ncbi:hypothetical protein BKA93DRAFT_2649 [Sparassis latifolia]
MSDGEIPVRFCDLGPLLRAAMCAWRLACTAWCIAVIWNRCGSNTAGPVVGPAVRAPAIAAGYRIDQALDALWVLCVPKGMDTRPRTRLRPLAASYDDAHAFNVVSSQGEFSEMTSAHCRFARCVGPSLLVRSAGESCARLRKQTTTVRPRGASIEDIVMRPECHCDRGVSGGVAVDLLSEQRGRARSSIWARSRTRTALSKGEH